MVTAYGGIVLVGSLLLSRRRFYALAAFTLVAAVAVFVLDLNGLTRQPDRALLDAGRSCVEFLVVITLFATLGASRPSTLFGSLGDAHLASSGDPVTGLANRAGFLQAAARSSPSRKRDRSAACSCWSTSTPFAA